MNRTRVCDFCGRPAELLRGNRQRDGQRRLEMDEDGLWICSECKNRVISTPTGLENEDDSELDEKVKALIGKSAGAICRTLELPYIPPYRSIIDAASKIAYDEDRYMSAWCFVTQWIDGTTVWQSEDRARIALVFIDGDVQVETRI